VKVLVKVNKIGASLDNLIREKLKDKKLPECLGNMAPPLITDVVAMDASIFRVKDSIPEENIVLHDIHDIVQYKTYDTDVSYSRFILDVNGAHEIDSFKENLASSYVDRISSCATCKYIDLCDKLTKHYLQTIKLLEENQC